MQRALHERRVGWPGVQQASAAHGVLVALSGRKQLRAVVGEIRTDGLLAHVRLRLGDQTLTAVITRMLSQS